jgi:hypothetical protein
MAKKIVPIKYTSRDYDSIRGDLINFAKRYYPDIIQDFNEGSFNSFMFDSVSYVGDILSFYLDFQANESFLTTAIQYSNIIKLGEELGYKFANTTAASQGLAAFVAALPADSEGKPDLSYIPTLKRGSVFTTEDGKSFSLVEDVRMYIPNKTLITVSELNANGTPSQYAIKNYGKVISGELLQQKFSVGDFTKFLKLTLNSSNVTEIVKIIDSEGHEYFEVDYLSQNTVYREMRNVSSDKEKIPSVMRLYSVPRRFIVQRDQNSTSIVFGANSSTTDQNYKDILAEPTTFILDIENKKYFSDRYFDPNAMVTSDKLGVGPSNTTITIIYRQNTSNNVNVSTGYLNTVTSAIVEFDDPDRLITDKKNIIIQSIEVENEEPILGSVDLPNSEELKIRIKDNFAAQNRAVTLRDYESLCYSMPVKFGSVKRARTIKDMDSFRRNLNLYILSEDVDGNFAKAPDTLKNNLKLWLNNNKMALDTIDILDAKIINLKINFTVVGNSRFNKSDALYSSKQALINYFARKPEIGEPLQITDIQNVLNKLDQVSDVVKLEITQQTGLKYSSVYFNVNDNYSLDERYIVIPSNAVYEVKYPLVDINGVVI